LKRAERKLNIVVNKAKNMLYIRSVQARREEKARKERIKEEFLVLVDLFLIRDLKKQATILE
jgi:hypothetical protein